MKTKDILLVDDESDYLHLLSMLLESEGLNVCTASGGVNALETLEHKKFKILITDYRMPVINGIELAARAKERYSDIRIIMITGEKLTEIETVAAVAGISKILPKPLEFQKLLSTIWSLMQERQNHGHGERQLAGRPKE